MAHARGHAQCVHAAFHVVSPSWVLCTAFALFSSVFYSLAVPVSSLVASALVSFAFVFSSLSLCDCLCL
ncbi:hypothetical protein BDN70DRAFT_11631 [Pholiota conissans]|uniref:Uncharacterized protein n=1 Tax=Pholiota conissans TaxID=109636 RepID=A0A9P6D0K2_9AGAR|nr:hypothetical protein BDN70DRAFT_11631 [Pholiota conissans]